MIGVFSILSLAVAVAVSPAAAIDMEAARRGGPAAFTETKFITAEAKPMASGRSLWASEARMGGAASAWGSDDARMSSGRSAGWAAAADSAMSADKMVASGRSLWSSDAKMAAAPAVWTSETKVSSAPSAFAAQGMASGRSLWSSDARMAAPSAWKAEERMMSSGRSMLNADAKMVATGRSAWKEEHAAHLHKDAQPAIPILQQQYEMNDPSSYVYSYQTANGIAAQEQASMKSGEAEAVQGVYSWEAPNGQKFAVEYVADETGYHARGAHIPEIPRAIARSLEWNAAHPEEEDARAAAAWESDSSAWGSSAKSAGASWASSSKVEAAPAWASSARMGAASGRSAWESASKIEAAPAWASSAKVEAAPAWASSAKMDVASGRSAWQSESSAALPSWKVDSSVVRTVSAAPSLKMSSGRSAWVSEHSAALPAWESSAKIASANAASAWDSAAASSGRSSWESRSAAAALPASSEMRADGLGTVKITETYHQGAVSGIGAGLDTTSFLPAGRSARQTVVRVPSTLGASILG